MAMRAVDSMMLKMIPVLRCFQKASVGIFAIAILFNIFIVLQASIATPLAPPAALADTLPAAAAPAPAACLSSGDGFLKARLKGSIDATIDWPNAGTRCEGEERPSHGGMRLSFRRDPGSAPDLLFVFGLSHVRENQPASGVGVNVTVILQGSSRIFGTQGESRCTIDSLRQTRLPDAAAPATRRYRVEARGFCTAPARAVRGEGSVLLTTFDFAGAVTFDDKDPST